MSFVPVYQKGFVRHEGNSHLHVQTLAAIESQGASDEEFGSRKWLDACELQVIEFTDGAWALTDSTTVLPNNKTWRGSFRTWSEFAHAETGIQQKIPAMPQSQNLNEIEEDARQALEAADPLDQVLGSIGKFNAGEMYYEVFSKELHGVPFLCVSTLVYDGIEYSECNSRDCDIPFHSYVFRRVKFVNGRLIFSDESAMVNSLMSAYLWLKTWGEVVHDLPYHFHVIAAQQGR